ncbi:MAG: SNF2-related protein [Leptolyngbyaceae bacterium]|nr:SNF2-related protein [Leptolyngbyaceae bacterium]
MIQLNQLNPTTVPPLSGPLTDYHAQYFAHELTRRYASDNLAKLAGTFASAQVDLNPHQVDAALFAFRSPLSKGALLADEVGLGKTIEAGLVMAQKWAERSRRILVITPANLRKQWQQELSEKFFLPCTILETKSYNAQVKAGNAHPFDGGTSIIICSYQFARGKETDVRGIPWDLVVIDEAHRLRNVYKSDNVIANALRRALAGRHKLLLTATPLQNSLLELYGLVSFIDEQAFGDLKSFREQFSSVRQAQTFEVLKARLEPLCHRTLRRQVTAYVRFTKRHPLVEEFTPADSEDRLYQLVSDYLQRDNLQALPAGQRSLITLVLRKLLASSTFAIAGALTSMSKRLKAKLNQQQGGESLTDSLDEDYEGLEETADEWGEDEDESAPTNAEQSALAQEIAELDAFAQLATSIKRNAKGMALLKALKVAFRETMRLGGAEKAIIFTESCRTQDYLLRLLSASEWSEGIVLFNGSNTDDRSKAIYTEWVQRYQGSDRITGSKTADMRSALVDYFREQGRIMIATEAAAEGINLQFCSLIINYDLPWNPQRIEQRIGRCHRYGQTHDVVVVNFLNRKNDADRRVYQLLSEKFRLFDGVFGTSDEVLGAIESGVDFEKRIADIYQRCRKPDEIGQAFDQLQLELNLEIKEAMTDTRRKLLEHFDDEVREKLRIRDENSKTVLSLFEQRLMQLTRHELQGKANFLDSATFELMDGSDFPPAPSIPLGRYELPRRTGTAYTYRLGHPLAEAILERAKTRTLPPATLQFDYEAHEGKVSILEPLRGQRGLLSLTLLAVESLEQAEEHLLFAAMTDGGEPLDQEQAQRLLSLPGTVVAAGIEPSCRVSGEQLAAMTQQRQQQVYQDISERNATFFQAETEKLDAWAEDLKVVLERDLKDLDRQIREAKRSATGALSLEAKLAGQRQVKALEKQRNQKRRQLFDAQDEIDERRDELIAQLEGKLEQKSELQRLFTLRWRLD